MSLPTYLSIVDTENKKKMGTLIGKGQSNHSNWINGILSADDFNKYIHLLVKNFIKDGIVYSESILPHDSDQGVLLGKFINFVKSNHGVKKIYAMINSPSKTGREISHQNWICLEFNDDSIHLTRFEPSGDNRDFEERFRIKATCKKIIELLCSHHKKKPTITTNKKAFGLNQVSGCRLFSTILASLHVCDIPLSNLTSLIKWYPGSTDQNYFGCEVNNQIKKYIRGKNDDRIHQRSSRSRSRALFSFTKQKSARKTPRKSKSARKTPRKSKSARKTSTKKKSARKSIKMTKI
jgi:hypothetical protein